MAITDELTPVAFIMRLAISRHVAKDRNEGGLAPALTPLDPLTCQMTGRGQCQGAPGQNLDKAGAVKARLTDASSCSPRRNISQERPVVRLRTCLGLSSLLQLAPKGRTSRVPVQSWSFLHCALEVPHGRLRHVPPNAGAVRGLPAVLWSMAHRLRSRTSTPYLLPRRCHRAIQRHLASTDTTALGPAWISQ